MLLIFAGCGGGSGKDAGSTTTPAPVPPVEDSYLKFDLIEVAGTPLRKLRIYFNNNKTTGSVSSPFYMANVNNWAPMSQTVSDSSGWGHTDLSNIIQPKIIKLVYGGDLAANSWAAAIQNSLYYDPAENNLQFCVNNNALSPGACAGAYEVVKLLSSVKNQDMTYTYRLGLRSDLIYGAKDAPFVMGDFNGWAVQPISDTDADGYYEINITTFNREHKLAYGGNLAANSWADSTKSIYWDSTANSLAIEFADGELRNKGGITTYPIPGAYGDNFVRFALSGNTLTIYLNNNKVSGSKARPFYIGSQNLWASSIPQIMPNTSGWGNVSLDVSTTSTLYFNYGGDNSAASQSDWTWAPIAASAYYNPSVRYLCAKIGGGRVAACQ